MYCLSSQLNFPELPWILVTLNNFCYYFKTTAHDDNDDNIQTSTFFWNIKIISFERNRKATEKENKQIFVVSATEAFSKKENEAYEKS